uniref:DNA-directed RNA polymerase n=1 Tax=viral metagenome TaxID=1070528 RepID=A0A6C0HCU0_9ZZZZ
MSGFKPRTQLQMMKSKKEDEFEYGGGSDLDDDKSSNDDEDDEEVDEDVEEEEQEVGGEVVSEEEEEEEELEGGGKEGNDDSDEDEDIPLASAAASAINPLAPVLDSDDDDDDVDESYLQKFNASVNKNYIMDFHPECVTNNYDEIVGLTKIIRDTENNIIDDLHKTLPYLTKYERARVLGQRAKQINAGAKVFVKVPENVIDGYLIAEQELAQKRIPFIIRRPTPGGGCEYWNLKDLELIQF